MESNNSILPTEPQTGTRARWAFASTPSELRSTYSKEQVRRAAKKIGLVAQFRMNCGWRLVDQARNTVIAGDNLELTASDVVSYCLEKLRKKPGKCHGMALNANNKLIECPESSLAIDRQTGRPCRYHSKACQTWTNNRRKTGRKLGDVYVKGKTVRGLVPLGPCPGWTIRDGVIVVCGESRADSVSRIYHRKCPPQARRWQKHGYSLGDCVKHLCGYRNCKKGEGAARGTVQRIDPSKKGAYFCTPSCAAAESAARKADRATLKLADAEQLVLDLQAEIEVLRREKDFEIAAKEAQLEAAKKRAAQFKGGWNKKLKERELVRELVAPYREAGLKPDWDAIVIEYHRKTGETCTKDSLRKLLERA